MTFKLFGIGPGNFQKTLEAYVTENPYLASLEHMNHAHNQFVQTFLQ